MSMGLLRQAIARVGANVDLAMFNFDLNYSIGLNSVTTTSYRTGYHMFQLNLAYIFSSRFRATSANSNPTVDRADVVNRPRAPGPMRRGLPRRGPRSTGALRQE